MAERDGMFERMLAVAAERLAGRDPEALAARAGVRFDGAAFHLSTLGRETAVSWPEPAFDPPVDGWLRLLILHYLDLADGTEPAGELIPFAGMKDGMVRGGGFDRRSETALSALAERLGPEELLRRCLALGGRELASNADLAAVIPLLPRFPVTVKLWLADEDFPASGRLLADASADHYLTIEDAVTAGGLLLEALGK